MSPPIVNDDQPLQLSYLPTDLVDRTDEQAALECMVENTGGLPNLHIQGKHGTGKTVTLKRVLSDSDDVNAYYLSCTEYDSQYKILKRLHKLLTGDSINDGHHSSDLKRLVENRLGAQPSVIVLDDIDFLLHNDGDDLLYFLSRLGTGNVGVVAVSTHRCSLQESLEKRTYSSLYPQRLEVEPYQADHLYQILADRARAALKPRSVHQEALTYIASSTSNAAFAIEWFRQAAETATDVVTEDAVKESYQDGYSEYIDWLLTPFSEHHRVLYRVIEATGENQPITTGSVYDQYKEQRENEGDDVLSNRRLSDFLKDLETLDLITAKYHYGGEQGRTREISLNHPV